MKRARRLSQRLVRWTSLCVCFALISSSLLTVPFQTTNATGGSSKVLSRNNQTQSLGFLAKLGGFFAGLLVPQGGGPPSIPGANLPDLEAARVANPADPVAPPPIASTQECPDCTPCPTCGPGTTNHAPVVSAGGPYYGTAGTATSFNGLGSFDVDPGDGISDYAWSFGNNTAVVHGATPSHTYQSAGNYTVTLTVTDRYSTTSVASTTASVAAAATPTPSPSPGSTQGNAASFVSQTVPASMTAGGRYPVSVTMRNTGSSTWSAAHLYRLGSQNPQDNGTWGTGRIFLRSDVAPGADGIFTFMVIAPYSGVEEPPPASFQWRMVQDGVEWFGDYTPNQTVTIASNYQPPRGDAPNLGSRADLFNARLLPENRTGQPGVDLLSRNFNWGLSLLDLPGRDGLNLSLPLSYNSLSVWTKVVPPPAPSMGRMCSNLGPCPPSYQAPTSRTFDADRGSPSPGFRLDSGTIRKQPVRRQLLPDADAFREPRRITQYIRHERLRVS
jgi:hypothetical protein